MLRYPTVGLAHAPTAPLKPPAYRLTVLAFFTLVLLHEPAFANKFETIGGGVTGSTKIKLDWLQGFLYVVGGISLFSAVLAVLVPHNNALFLNFGNWKQSAVVLFVIAAISFGGALLL